MQNFEQSATSQEPNPSPFKNNNTQRPLIIAAVLLTVASLGLGYAVGHRQGLTVVGFDADAEQLADIVKKQKVTLESATKNLNSAVQERDLAVNNAKGLTETLNAERQLHFQAESLNALYRETLRQRGGLPLTVQNLSIKPLPENAFEYQLDLVQISPAKRRASGILELHLINNSEILVVPMEKSSFSFDEFERLTGRWTMPKGFSPQFIEVHIKGAVPVVKRFSWQQGQPVNSGATMAAEVPQAQANAR